MADALRVAGVVPAAGASRRMGRPKASLALEGRTFLERVVEALSGAGCAPIMVVIPEGVAELETEAERVGARILRNPHPGEGPITSLRLALGALAAEIDAIAWLPLDHPLVAAGHVRRLLRAAEASGADVTLPVHGSKRGHPAILRRTLFGELADPLLEGGARTVVHRHLPGACLVPFDDDAVTVDVDTPEAYQALRRRFSESPVEAP